MLQILVCERAQVHSVGICPEVCVHAPVCVCVLGGGLMVDGGEAAICSELLLTSVCRAITQLVRHARHQPSIKGCAKENTGWGALHSRAGSGQ